VLQASALIFFAYIGFQDIANLAEDAENPEKNLSKALILSIVITSLLYISVAFASVSLVDWKQLSMSASPLALAASQSLGLSSFVLLSIIALFATSNTVLILLIVCSRTIYGMARESRLPRPFSKISKRGSPALAIVLAFILASAFTLLKNLGLVAEITNFGTFITFTSVNLSAIWLRYKRPELKRPFKTPIEIRRIPIIPLIGLLSSWLLITQLKIEAIIIGILALIIGLAFYWFCKTPLAKRIQCDIKE